MIQTLNSKIEDTKPIMKIIEKSIAICVIILGVVSISLKIWELWYSFNLINEFRLELNYQISITKIFKNYHIGFITSIIEIFGGLTLLFRKRIGYYLTLFVCSKQVLGFIVSLGFKDLKDPEQFTILIIGSIFGFIFLTLTLLLLLPKIRKRYSITSFGLIMVLIFSLLSVVYSFWIN